MTMEANYRASAERYDSMVYRRCGRSGLKLPVISLGLWHNFGETTPHETKRDMCLTAFDAGSQKADRIDVGPVLSTAVLQGDFR